MSTKWTATIVSVVMIAIVVIVFPIVMTGSDDILRERTVDIGANVVNTGGTGTMTLSADLYDDSVDWVVSTTSNVGSDTAVASTYNATTQLLTMTGLVGTPMGVGTRNITCTYDADNTTAYTGLKETVEVAPLLLWVGALIGVGATGIVGIRTLRRMD